MTVFLVISVTAAAVLLLLFIMQSIEMRSIKRQLRSFSDRETRELIHSKFGGKNAHELINEINSLLKKMRMGQELYKRKSHDMEQMITNISHDLRTPLTSAMGYINIILNSDMTETEKEVQLNIVEKRLLRLEELINSFFEFSRIISQERPPELEKLNLIEILQDSIVNYYDDYCSVSREICLKCDITKLPVFSNRIMLTRIFDNLISNAYKHGRGTLEVSVDAGEKIRICFKNELIDAYIDTERIFDEFYSTDISRTKGNTGLGLAIAKQFTRMLGGNIYASCEDGSFSVIIEFPEFHKE